MGTVTAPRGTTLGYDILQVFPFTSETKRMGIIVRDKSTGEIIFYMKGADVVMSTIVQYNDWLMEEVDNMAREGLRTLVVAKKILTEEQLTMVALTIRTWHPIMLLAELSSVGIYFLSLIFLTDFFDSEFIQTGDFVWKTLLITAISCLPLYLIKFLRNRFSPASYRKLQ